MANSIAKKHTILIPSGTYHAPDNRHLFVVCTDECDEGCHLIVPITSWTNNLCDDTCILVRGDHSFITHKSYVLYRKGRIEPASSLSSGIAKGFLKVYDPMNGQAFLRLFNGICRSIQTPRKIKAYVGCALPAASSPSKPG